MDSMGTFSRVRSTGSSLKSAPFHWKLFNPNGTLNSEGNTAWNTVNDFYSIEDTPHSRGHGTFAWKFPPGKVRHKSQYFEILKFVPGYSPIKVDGSSTVYDPYLQIPGGNSVPLSKLPMVADSTFFSLNREAFNYFSEVFPEELSLSEFLAGFTQLKDLIPRLQGSIAKSFTGGYLNKKFGWDNLLSDLETLTHITRDVRSRLDYLKRTHGIPTRLGFSRPMVSPLTHDVGEAATVFVNGDCTGRYVITHARIDMRATATIVQTLDHLDGAVGMLRGLTAAFGLNNPIKALWVNLPFSFVVDWFFKISDHLDSLTRLNPAAGWNITNVSSSYKTTVRYDCFMDFARGGYISQSNLMGRFHVNEYRRYIGLPLSLADLLPVSQLSPTQLTLLLALIHHQQ